MKKLILLIFIFSFLSELKASELHEAEVKRLIKVGVESVLHEAAARGYTEIAESFIKAGVDVNAKDYNGLTPLHYASQKAHPKTVESLIKNGAFVNAKSKEGETPLHRTYDPKVVKILIKAGADVNLKDKSGAIPLFYAYFTEQRDLQKIYLENGADINSKDKDGKTALHIYSKEGNLRIVKAIIRDGANFNVKDKSGNTPLHDAARYGEVEVAKHLIKKGADVNAKNQWGQTPLHLISKLPYWYSIKNRGYNKSSNPENNKEITKLLIAKGAYVNEKDKEGKTPLMEAVQLGSLSRVETLLKHGANTYIKNNAGQMAYDFTLVKQVGSLGRSEKSLLLIQKMLKESSKKAKNKALPRTSVFKPKPKARR